MSDCLASMGNHPNIIACSLVGNWIRAEILHQWHLQSSDQYRLFVFWRYDGSQLTQVQIPTWTPFSNIREYRFRKRWINVILVSINTQYLVPGEKKFKPQSVIFIVRSGLLCGWSRALIWWGLRWFVTWSLFSCCFLLTLINLKSCFAPQNFKRQRHLVHLYTTSYDDLFSRHVLFSFTYL